MLCRREVKGKYFIINFMFTMYHKTVTPTEPYSTRVMVMEHWKQVWMVTGYCSGTIASLSSSS